MALWTYPILVGLNDVFKIWGASVQGGGRYEVDPELRRRKVSEAHC